MSDPAICRHGKPAIAGTHEASAYSERCRPVRVLTATNAPTWRALRHAPHWLLSEPSIEGALKSLREDPVPLVRTDVAWSEHCKVRRTVKQELAYSLLHSLLRQARVMRQKALRLMGRRQRSA